MGNAGIQTRHFFQFEVNCPKHCYMESGEIASDGDHRCNNTTSSFN
jgi:hypothetical protein